MDPGNETYELAVIMMGCMSVCTETLPNYKTAAVRANYIILGSSLLINNQHVLRNTKDLLIDDCVEELQRLTSIQMHSWLSGRFSCVLAFVPSYRHLLDLHHFLSFGVVMSVCPTRWALNPL